MLAPRQAGQRPGRSGGLVRDRRRSARAGDCAAPRLVSVSEPMLELEEVVKRYRGGGEDVRAVDGVSLRVEAGEMLALQGPSGSGKTTLLLLAAAAVPADG